MTSKEQSDTVRGPIGWSPAVTYANGDVINSFGHFGMACATLKITAGGFSKTIDMGARARHRRSKAQARARRALTPTCTRQ